MHTYSSAYESEIFLSKVHFLSKYLDKKEIVNKNCQLCWANIGRVLLHGLERKTFLKRRKSLQYFYALRLVVRHTMVLKWIKPARIKFTWCLFTNFSKLVSSDAHNFLFRSLPILAGICHLVQLCVTGAFLTAAAPRPRGARGSSSLAIEYSM